MVGNLVSVVPFQLRWHLLLINKHPLADVADGGWGQLPAVFAKSRSHGLLEVQRTLVIQGSQQSQQGLVTGKFGQGRHINPGSGTQQGCQWLGIAFQQVLLTIHKQGGFTSQFMVGKAGAFVPAQLLAGADGYRQVFCFSGFLCWHHNVHALGGGGELAKPLGQVAAVAQLLADHGIQAVDNLRTDGAGVVLHLKVRVVQVFGRFFFLTQEISEAGQEVIDGGRTKPDRQRNAVVFGHTMVADARRQVQHVAWRQRYGFLAVPAAQNAQGRTVYPRRGVVAVAAKGPAAMTLGLQQENIVHVVVGANTATFRGVAGHDVIQAPVGNEAEVLENIGYLWYPVVKALNQQGPVLFRQAAETVRVKRPVVQLPGFTGIVFNDDAGFHRFFAGQASQFVWADWAREAGKCLTDHQGLFLPVIPQIFRSCQYAKHVHGVAPV